ncbi:MAG: CHAT domain-containing protein [Bacteroidetes bacterium]|nr:CHAT domain-containing protein [Bacteroidota bacterium]MBU1718594.1 CHAT domain-containing protein [Bacteroidota bacterium]
MKRLYFLLIIISFFIPDFVSGQLLPFRQKQLNKADSLFNLREYQKAVPLYEALISQSADVEPAIMGPIYIRAGESQYYIQQYEAAGKYFNKAHEIGLSTGNESLRAEAVNNIGVICLKSGMYDKAIGYLEESLEQNIKSGDTTMFAVNMNNIGRVYQLWGKMDKARDYLEQAQLIFLEQNDMEKVARISNNIGTVYYELGDNRKAYEHFNISLEWDKEIGDTASMAKDMNNLGLVYQRYRQYDKAIIIFSDAYIISERLKDEAACATTLHNIGLSHELSGDHVKAIEYYRKSLKIKEKLGDELAIATTTGNIGLIYYSSGEFDDAVLYLTESVKIYEKLRLTAPGGTRRDFLAHQIKIYDYLIGCYKHKNDIPAMFNAIEISRAKYLSEQLYGSEDVPVPSLSSVITETPSNRMYIIFSTVGNPLINALIITSEGARTYEISEKKLVMDAYTKVRFDNTFLLGVLKQKGIDNINIRDTLPKPILEKIINIETVVQYYRYLLTDQGNESYEKMLELAKILYKHLLAPALKDMGGQRELVVIPDGILSYIPFEALIDPAGNYVVENYDVRYSQSLSIFDMVSRRKYAPKESAVLAMGGAVYEPAIWQQEIDAAIGKAGAINTEGHKKGIRRDHELDDEELRFYRRKVDMAMRSGSGFNEIFELLGYKTWFNLPGTYLEVKNIGKLFEKSRVFTGYEVSEQKLRNLSSSGELEKYDILHFSTHGIVVPGLPELSALVFTNNNDSLYDGYLRMGEIANLKTKASFVCLSACETGLGKIYKGEGVVGLTQAFMVAGANSISVSLWQVSDLSTSTYMTQMYGLYVNEKKSFSEAINQAKRDFIRNFSGSEWEKPYYWAGFVFYGN